MAIHVDSRSLASYGAFLSPIHPTIEHSNVRGSRHHLADVVRYRKE